MPAFTLIEKQYNGNDLVEILKDDQPFWENLPGAGRHFSFGLTKASAIVSSLPIIERFVDTQGRYPAEGYCVEVEDKRMERRYRVSCKQNFCTGNGGLIYSPYLDISKASGEPLLKFGLLKATALLELSDELEAFVEFSCF